MLAHHVRLAVPRACRSGSCAPSLTRRTTRYTSAPAAAASLPVFCLAASRAVAAAAAAAPYTHDARAGAQRRRHFSSTSAARRREGPVDPAASVPPPTPSPPLSQEAAAAAAAAKAGPSQTQDQHDQYQQQQKQQQSRRRTRRRILFGAAYLLLGSTLGSVVRAALAPPDLPAPGTEQDAYLVAAIAEKARKLPLYQRLASDPAWTGWDAYEEFQTRTSPPSSSSSAAATSTSSDTATATTTTTKQPRAGPSLTSSTLSGARGLAYQHIFHNAATHELVSIVYLGSSIAGWPGVVHGGAIATVLDETLGRCAVRLFPARTGVTANLEMDYKAPTRTEGFYVVRVRPAALEEEGGQEEEGRGKKDKKEGAKGDRKRWVMGELERLDGTVCVRAKALFVVPKGVKLAPISDRY